MGMKFGGPSVTRLFCLLLSPCSCFRAEPVSTWEVHGVCSNCMPVQTTVQAVLSESGAATPRGSFQSSHLQSLAAASGFQEG